MAVCTWFASSTLGVCSEAPTLFSAAFSFPLVSISDQVSLAHGLELTGIPLVPHGLPLRSCFPFSLFDSVEIWAEFPLVFLIRNVDNGGVYL